MPVSRSKPFPFPAAPFTTADFGLAGSGIDFLGLRLINFRVVFEKLIPELNNATGDLGALWIATWIPWKFRQLAQRREDFTNARYRRFRRAIEVALAWCDREQSLASQHFGTVFRGVGTRQNKRITFPNRLTFEDVGRTDSTSLFAAPLYGPALRYLGLHADVWEAEDGALSNIPKVGDGVATRVAEWLDSTLARAIQSRTVLTLDPPAVSAAVLDELGRAGLHSCGARNAPASLKRAFAAQLLNPENAGGMARLLTTRLILETLDRAGESTTDDLRNIWLTGRLPNGRMLRLANEEVTVHRRLWAIFQARQLQRYAIELFLQLFERALADGASSLDAIADHALATWDAAPATFQRAVIGEARAVVTGGDVQELSEAWNREVHPGHESFDWHAEGNELDHALRTLARWTLRIRAWGDWQSAHPEIAWGGADRIGATWLLRWLDARARQPLRELLRGFFGELIFAQHLRIALGRFERQKQKLRFLLSDHGIVLTGAARRRPAPDPVVMADRLDAFSNLLCDLGVLSQNGESRLSAGPLASVTRF